MTKSEKNQELHSHIPYITGNMIHMYDKQITFDGGFSSFPYLNTRYLRLGFSMFP